MNNRAAGRLISCGLKHDQVNKAQKSVLLDKLVGQWNPVSKSYTKMKHLMDLMEASIGLGGGPVRGINFTSRCREIALQLREHLAGKPSEDIMFATVLALYRVKSHVEKLLRLDDPLTGIYLILE